MTIPTIRGTTAPTESDLVREWSIVIAHLHPTAVGNAVIGFIGRIVDDSEEDGRILLVDPFLYNDGAVVQRDGRSKEAQVTWVRSIAPVCGLTVPSMRVTPLAIVPLTDLPPGQVEAIRNKLVVAWDGREQLLRQSGRVQVASAGTSFEVPRS